MTTRKGKPGPKAKNPDYLLSRIQRQKLDRRRQKNKESAARARLKLKSDLENNQKEVKQLERENHEMSYLQLRLEKLNGELSSLVQNVPVEPVDCGNQVAVSYSTSTSNSSVYSYAGPPPQATCDNWLNYNYYYQDCVDYRYVATNAGYKNPTTISQMWQNASNGWPQPQAELQKL